MNNKAVFLGIREDGSHYFYSIVDNKSITVYVRGDSKFALKFDKKGKVYFFATLSEATSKEGRKYWVASEETPAPAPAESQPAQQ